MFPGCTTPSCRSSRPSINYGTPAIHPPGTKQPHRPLARPAINPGDIPTQRIIVGQVVASASPLLLQTLLGSCVAVCLHDPVAKAGGMNHILLPGGRYDQRTSHFGANAMELLINGIMQAGGERCRLVAKAFGAANVLAGLRAPTCGDLNAAFVRQYLSNERIPLQAQRLGGTSAVQVSFRTDTGTATVRSIDGSRLATVLSVEETYSTDHCAEENFTGEVTLF